MGTYRILEGNIERLEKKIKRIQNKCNKYGTHFHYERVGEEVIEKTFNKGTELEKTVAYNYIVVEAEGKAVINDWQFVCEINHTEHGNIFRGVSVIEVPERYYITDTVCEHCNTKRRRRNTYLVQNTITGEFKQVGKSCLKDYTNGMDAELVASMLDMLDRIVEGEQPNTDERYEPFYKTQKALETAVEVIRVFGYEKRNPYGDMYSTANRTYIAHEYFLRGGLKYKDDFEKKVIDKLKAENFNPEAEEVKETVQKALEWMQNVEATNNYLHNAQTIAKGEYVRIKDLGILVSIIPCYYRHIQKEMEYSKEQKERAEQRAKSNHIGEVGERIAVDVKDFEVITGWETIYGYTKVYRITDTNDNVFTWKTTTDLDRKDIVLTATVKEHKEYKGEKQTEVTKCRVKAKRFTLG